MKALIALIILLPMNIFISCNNARTSPPSTTAHDTVVIVPKALDDESKAAGFIRKSSPDENLVEEMYAELVNTKPKLHKIEEQIDLVGQNDSLEAFRNYDGKSDRYYSSAKMIAENISDSSIRKKALELIAASAEKYKHRASSLDSLQKTILSKEKDISNLHEYLKLAVTLPLMEKYQKDKLPSEKTMKDKIKSQDEVINQLGIKN